MRANEGQDPQWTSGPLDSQFSTLLRTDGCSFLFACLFVSLCSVSKKKNQRTLIQPTIRPIFQEMAESL